ncbi:MAG: M16 family metallopeptidase [Thermoanaerobaculia bacterium]
MSLLDNGRRTISRHQLENGLRLVLHRDDTLPLVSVNLWYRVGSKNESPGRTGFAHLFEHMLFQGSAHVGTNDHFGHLQSVGGVANGSTWYDRTNYYETLPAHELDLGLWLESDRMGFLLEGLSSEKLEMQRQVVMNERRQRVDNQPYGRASELLFEALFPEGHPYRWPVIGTMADIEAASLEDVRSFFRRYYGPENAVLSIAGDFDPAATIAAVERWFGEIPRGPAPPPVRAPLPALAQSSRLELTDRVQLTRIYLAFRVERFGLPDWWTAFQAAGLLADGKSSPLVDDLVVREELAQDVSAYVYPTEEVGVMVLVATARPGIEAERLEERIRLHLDRLAGGNGDALRWTIEEELERARRRALVSVHSELQSLEHRADLLSQYTTYFDEPERAFTESAALSAIEPSGVASFAVERLGVDRAVTLVVRPESR